MHPQCQHLVRLARSRSCRYTDCCTSQNLLGGSCFLKEKVTVMEFIGFAIIMVGVYVYNKVESEVVAEQKNKPNVDVNVQSTGASSSQQDPFLIEDQTVEGAEDEIIAV